LIVLSAAMGEYCHKCPPVALNAADVVPLAFPTVQLYLPKMSLTDLAIVSTVLYVPAVVVVTTFVCRYVSLIVIITPFFFQVTVVAGPPAEVQVRDLVESLYTSAVVVGVPTTQKINIMQWTLLAVVNLPDVAEFTLLVRNVVYVRLAQAYLKKWFVLCPSYTLYNGLFYVRTWYEVYHLH